MALVKSPVGGLRSFWSTIKAHPIVFVLVGMLFGAFLFPMIAKWLGAVKAKGGAVASVIPAKFTA